MANDLLTSNDGIKREKARITKNGEVFTPTVLVKRLLDKIPEEKWKDPKATFLEPCCGNGQIVIGMLERRISSGISPIIALQTLFGVELMQDNVDLCKSRIRDVLRVNKVKITKKVNNIIDHNFVCSDFFKWDFENWCPKEQPESSESELSELFT